MTGDPLVFTVAGRPRPQGSKTGVIDARTGSVRMLEGRNSTQRARHHDWRGLVTSEAWVAMTRARRRVPFQGPVGVLLAFRFSRPASAKAGTHWKSSKPDTDKLARSVHDSLQAAGVLGDDSQIAVQVAAKFLTTTPGGPDGALIAVWHLDHHDPAIVAPTAVTDAVAAFRIEQDAA